MRNRYNVLVFEYAIVYILTFQFLNNEQYFYVPEIRDNIQDCEIK